MTEAIFLKEIDNEAKSLFKEIIKLQEIDDNRKIEFKNSRNGNESDSKRFIQEIIEQQPRKVKTLHSLDYDEKSFDV